MITTIIENFSLIATLLAANYVLAAVCAVREVMASRTSQGSIAWLVSLIFLPFPTTFVYLVVGWKHFDDYAITRSKARHNRLIRAEELKVIDRETGSKWPVLLRTASLPFLAGNQTQLLIDGRATFDSLFTGIAAAEKFILIQFYILRDDALGKRLAEALIERARAGVAIYVLYDDIGSSGLPRRYRERLRAEGIKIFGFNQRHRLMQLYGPMRINYRNHRKLVVVDGRVAWTGGHNVGIEYLGQDPAVGYWRDTFLRVEGPAAFSCVLIFREDWAWATGEELKFPPPGGADPEAGAPVLVMATGPADKLESCAIAFTDIIAQARERLWIVSPYFVPDTDVRTALYAAAMRGVDVRVMLPEKPDHLLVWLGSNAHADMMVEHGIAIYRYHKGFLHQKVLLMDDRITSVGSVNFDNRSFAINFELTIWMTDHAMIEAVESMLLHDFDNCRRVTRAEVEKRNPVLRFVSQAAKLMSPLL